MNENMNLNMKPPVFNQAEYTREYNKQNYSEIKLFVRPDVKKKFRAAADAEGKSMTSFIVDAVKEYLS